jgi:hypothetical protein
MRSFPLHLIAVLGLACSSPRPETTILRECPANDLGGIVTPTSLELDPSVSVDGRGSLRVTTPQARVIPLYCFGDLDIDDAVLTCDADLRAANLDGKAYLELTCSFEGRGTFFARGLDQAVSSSPRWSRTRARLRLRPGEHPKDVQVNLVISGPGTAWIDDVRLTATSLAR